MEPTYRIIRRGLAWNVSIEDALATSMLTKAGAVRWALERSPDVAVQDCRDGPFRFARPERVAA